MSGTGILNADMPTLRRWIADGWRWWIDELQDLVPQRWRNAAARRLALFAYDPARGTLTQIATHGGENTGVRAPMAVVLPPGLTLIRTIEAPALGRRDIENLIELDADRIMPLIGSAMLLGMRIHPRDGAARTLVDVAAIARNDADALAQTLAGTGRTPVSVLVRAPEPGHPMPVDLLVALRRAGLLGTTDRSAAPLWLAAGFLFLFNIGLLVWRDAAMLDNLSAIVDQQQPAIKVSHGIIARMRRDDAIGNATRAARRTQEPLAQLARIDAAMPPGTWLQRYTWTGKGTTLAGFHPARADVPGALRKAGLTVDRYGDTSNEAPTPLGEPFEITLKPGKH